jgi:hypothetical protein
MRRLWTSIEWPSYPVSLCAAELFRRGDLGLLGVDDGLGELPGVGVGAFFDFGPDRLLS